MIVLKYTECDAAVRVLFDILGIRSFALLLRGILLALKLELTAVSLA